MIFRCARIGDYLRKYPGRRFLIVGKAPTRFEFENLASIEDPIIFINDAVQFEKFATRSVETFFFAHDAAQKVWITPEIKSTVVIPSGGASDSGADHPMLDMTQVLDNNLPPRIVTYEWGGWYGRNLRVHPRGEITRTGKLYLNSGTIHSAIHFAWLCGASGITFIGTDGFSNKYDEPVELRSCSNPLGVFGKIRQVQDWECEQLGLETEYVNEPRIEPLIPRTIHFV